MRVLIRGAGDLATGIAWRLKKSGFEILMTETPVPTTVRRTVAFSRVVYEGSAVVEGVRAVAAADIAEALAAIEEGQIPVVIDEEGLIRESFEPDVVVDAILAKHNLGTRITDAEFVIGVGPGFTAGEDCHCVIETKRGHYLGRTIYEGSAIPNTGVPGEVAGYSAERLIRADADGLFFPVRTIGDCVCKGDVVARICSSMDIDPAGSVPEDAIPVVAQMSGMIRGMLQPFVPVTAGMKCGDIDARTDPGQCLTISDKARAIGGGVLEAICGFEHRKSQRAVVLLAAGEGRRFGSNKLLATVGGRRLFEYAADSAATLRIPAVVVTNYDEIEEYSHKCGFTVIRNDRPEEGISRSIRLGTEALPNGTNSVMFAVCDQPGVSGEFFGRLWGAFVTGDKGIVCAGQNGEPSGNPCIFDSSYLRELKELSGDRGGKRVIMNHMDDVKVVTAATSELKDVDCPEDASEVFD